MDITLISAILVVIVAFFAGLEGILDEFQFHQPLVACTLIGLVTGNLVAGVMLGGSLQMIALGWANIGAAVAPDATCFCCRRYHHDQRWRLLSRRYCRCNNNCYPSCRCWSFPYNDRSYYLSWFGSRCRQCR